MSFRPFIRFVLAGAAFAALADTAAWAEDFTFRRVTVGSPPDGRRITVQVDPEAQARWVAAAPTVQSPNPQPSETPDVAVPAPGPVASRYDWFWDRVAVGLSEGEGRYLSAMATLDRPPGDASVPEPSLQHLQDIAQDFGAPILIATVGTRVSPALALAVISVESAGRAQARSHAGAQGLMQLIPATAERFGVRDAMDPAQNIRGGVAYLDWLLGEFDGDVVLALAGYNAGEGAVRRNGGVPPYAETRDYVPKVLAAWRVARGLCSTVPQLPTDGCVFVVRQTAQARTPAQTVID
ncbi:MAG: lytic transglycosylase domain-containing protein [Paracoccaceae bacterium]